MEDENSVQQNLLDYTQEQVKTRLEQMSILLQKQSTLRLGKNKKGAIKKRNHESKKLSWKTFLTAPKQISLKN